MYVSLVCVCTCVYVSMYIRVCVCMRVCACVYAYIFACSCACPCRVDAKTVQYVNERGMSAHIFAEDRPVRQGEDAVISLVKSLGSLDNMSSRPIELHLLTCIYALHTRTHHCTTIHTHTHTHARARGMPSTDTRTYPPHTHRPHPHTHTHKHIHQAYI